MPDKAKPTPKKRATNKGNLHEKTRKREDVGLGPAPDESGDLGLDYYHPAEDRPGQSPRDENAE